MKKILTLMLALCLPWGLASAENALKLVTCSAEAGGEVTLSIELDNDVYIMDFIGTLVLPEGMKVSLIDEEEDIAFLQVERAEKWRVRGDSKYYLDFTTYVIEGNKVIFRYDPIFRRSLNTAIAPGTGPVLKVQLKLDEKLAPGKYDIVMKDIRLQSVEQTRMPVYSDADLRDTFIPQEDCVAVQDVATEQSAVLEVKAKGDFTAISQVKAENNDAAPVYDLTGRRLSAVPQKGMYIQNRRKMMAR
jgi:hypothetical protein